MARCGHGTLFWTEVGMWPQLAMIQVALPQVSFHEFVPTQCALLRLKRWGVSMRAGSL